VLNDNQSQHDNTGSAYYVRRVVKVLKPRGCKADRAR